jgi:hypothetical protein
MNNSIQEYCKKINRELTIFDVGSLAVVTLLILVLGIYLEVETTKETSEILYQESLTEGASGEEKSSLPFGSNHGKTYTFSWCQGSSRILDKNKIIFPDEEHAKKSGRTLSKLCTK